MSEREGQIPTYGTAPGEGNSYQGLSREEKESLSDEDIRSRWEKRALRPGYQAVLSARYKIEDNILAYHEYRRDILEFLGEVIKGKRVLELGTGVGFITAGLALQAQQVVSIDIAQNMIDEAVKANKGIPNISYVRGELPDLDITPGAFDAAVVGSVLLHITQPPRLSATVEALKKAADTVFIAEHTYQTGIKVSDDTILRTPEEYHARFAPFEVVKSKTHQRLGDRLSFILYQNPKFGQRS